MGSDQRNAILAVVLSGIILFTWQYLYQPKATAPIEPAAQTVVTTNGQTAAPAKLEGASGPIEPVVAETYVLNTEKTKVSFSNTLEINGYNNEQAVFNFKDTVGEKPFSLFFDFGNGFKPLSFVADANQSGVFKSVENDVTLTAKLDMDGVTHFNIVSPKPFKYKMSFASTTNKLENGQNRVFAYYTEKLKHLDIGSEETGDTSVK